jgi:hypothetical protein
MGQYDDKVERQRKLLEAEEWSQGIKSLHAHSLNSMWYDTRPQDTDGKSVIDKIYNNGLVERKLESGEIVYFGKKLTGDELIYEWERNASPSVSQRLLR